MNDKQMYFRFYEAESDQRSELCEFETYHYFPHDFYPTSDFTVIAYTGEFYAVCMHYRNWKQIYHV